MIIRPRRADDLDRCVDALRLVHDADSYPLIWPDDPRGWLEPADEAWVAEDDGVIVGHVALKGDELSRLFVVPAARRGTVAVGRSLVERARAGRETLRLNVVDEQRSAAIAFYEATGWRFTHTTEADFAGRAVRLRHYVLDAGPPAVR